MCQHVLGACEAGASMGENVHQMRQARAHRKQHGGPLEAALSAVQVRERAHLTPAQVIDRLTSVAPKTVRGRTRIPAVVRNHVKLKVDGPVHETWKLGYLIDTIYLRDLWMHRVDVARASTGLSSSAAGHDGRIVADIVVDWARRHGKPFVLELTGAAGGAYAQRPDASGAERVELDAVEFCRAPGRSGAGNRPAHHDRPVLKPATASTRHPGSGVASAGNGKDGQPVTASLLIRSRMLAPATSESNQAPSTRDRASTEPTTRS